MFKMELFDPSFNETTSLLKVPHSEGCGTYPVSSGLSNPSQAEETIHFLHTETHRPDDVPGSNLPAVQLKATACVV
jgi:hypothetical protein